MKRALVISGGGSKGAFAVGVLQGLKIALPTLHFDIIVGTSAGALLTPLAATEELDLLQQIFTTITTDKVVTEHRLGDRLNEKSIFTAEPLYQLIKKFITDARYKTIMAAGKSMYIITTCLQTEGIVVYTNNAASKTSKLYTVKTLQDVAHLQLSILASACQPVLMTPVKIDFNYTQGNEKNYQYVDGGVREYAGLQMAIDQGATEVYAILLSTAGGEPVEAEYTSLFPILQRTLSILTEDVQKNDVFIPEQYANTIQYLQAVKQKMIADGVPQAKIDGWFAVNGTSNPLQAASAVKLYVIRPEAALGGGPGGLVFDPAEMQGMVEKGRQAAAVFVSGLKLEGRSGV